MTFVIWDMKHLTRILLILAATTGGASAQELNEARLKSLISAWRAVAGMPGGTAIRRQIAGLPGITPEKLLEALKARTGFPQIKAGASTLTVPFGAGAEQYIHLEIPEGYDPARAAPLILCLHGTAMNNEQLGSARGEAARWRALGPDQGFVIAAPAEMDPRGGWGYSAGERAQVMNALKEVSRRVNIDHGRVFVAGYSRGGHASWDCIIHHPDRFAGAVPCAGGIPYARLKLLPVLEHTAVYQHVGTLEEKGMLDNVRFAAKKLVAWKFRFKMREYEGRGHSIPVDTASMIPWFRQVRRPDHPREFTFVTADALYRRAWWIEIESFNKNKVSGPMKMNLRRFKTAEQRKWEYVRQDEKRVARVEALWKDGNKVRIKAKNVRKIRLHIDPDLYEADKRLIVSVNGRKKSWARVAADLDHVMDQFERTLDPSTVTLASVLLSL